MLNLDEIESTIRELENNATTFENCRKLAILYIVRDNNKNVNLSDSDASESIVVEEYKEILPTYRSYVDTKRKFQMHETTAEAVLARLKLLCEEIREFLSALYASTTSEIEREVIQKSVASLFL